jgi:hypothetical protein
MKSCRRSRRTTRQLQVDEEVRRMQTERVDLLRKLLLSVVPQRDQAIVDLVIDDLNSPDPVIRNLMALSLIVDGGLPVSLEDMRNAWKTVFGEDRRITRAADFVFEFMKGLNEKTQDSPTELPDDSRNAPLLE